MQHFDHLRTFPDGAVFCGQSSATLSLRRPNDAHHCPVPLKVVVEHHINDILSSIHGMASAPTPTLLTSTGQPLRGGECSVYKGIAGVLLSVTRSYTALPPTSPYRPALLDTMQLLFPVVLNEVRGWKHGLTKGVGYYIGPIGAHLVLLECGSVIAASGGPVAGDGAVQHLDDTLKACVASLLDLFNGVLVVVGQDMTEYNEEEEDEERRHPSMKLPNSRSSELDAEHLFGVAGTLFSLRTLEQLMRHAFRQRWANTIEATAMITSMRQRLASYLTLCGNTTGSSREDEEAASRTTQLLTWEWRGAHYIGAAHGNVGILTELLEHAHLLPAASQQLILLSVDALVDASYAQDGHLPTRQRAHASTAEQHSPSSSSCLVHWCHGAPGVVWMALLRRCSGEDCGGRRLPPWHAAEGNWIVPRRCGECICVLAMYRATRRPKYLFYANRFAAVMSTEEYMASTATYEDAQRVIPNIPDTPLGLMEGRSGTLCFLVELLYAPTTSAFPGYEVPAHDSSIAATEWMGLGAATPRQRHDVRTATEGSHLVAAPWYLAGMPQVLADPRSDDGIGLVAMNIPAVRCKVFTEMEAHHILSATTAAILPRDLELRPVRIGTGPTTAPLLRYLTHLTERVVSLFPDVFYHPPPATTQQTTIQSNYPRNVDKQRMWRRRNLCVGSRRAVQRLNLTSAYIVNYDCEHHSHIHSHTDASHVTLNLCLWNTAPAGNLVLEGDEGLFSFWHVVGEALVQRGDLPHHTHHLLDASHKITDWKQRNSRRQPAPDTSQFRRAQLVALFEYEEEETDFQAMLFDTCGRAIRARCLSEVPDSVLGEISLFLPLGDVGKLAACGSRVWQRVLDPRAGGLDASMLWRSRVMATRRLAMWLPYLWPEYYGEGAAGSPNIAPIVGKFKISDHEQKYLLTTPVLKKSIDELRLFSGITREVGPPSDATNQGSKPQAARRVSFGVDAALQEPPRWVTDHNRSVPECELNTLERIDWKVLLRHGLEWVNTCRTYFHRPLDEEGELDFDDDLVDDGDSGGGTGSSYTNPAVEREAGRLPLWNEKLVDWLACLGTTR
ncbi:Hypothetical protein, putative [Bodo saltans]|uniref:Uncharacterized protein n=1 Tax=Bodo saltans TaxID=75058 RepID=A0A0S4JMK8_BODSA|nr:Hypothetical protein, putative [Bodo saltans]|eukprot:CUG89741.1 Hypothetical protein, putative [Bodo saltans]